VKAHPQACILAGGTDVGLWVTKQQRDLETIIYAGDVAELRALEIGEGHLDIGAAVTYSEAIEAIAAEHEDFGELIRRLGSVQIRNAGTLGGNVANGSPIGDSMPALIALGASVVLRLGKKRREIPLEDLYIAYQETALRAGEFVERIRVPRARDDRRFHAWKISKRFDQDISAVCGAWRLELEGERVRDIRICYGGMAATPRRALNCEAALIGQPWTEAGLAPALDALERDYQPLTDMRASREYRMLAAQNLLRKFHRETTLRPGEGHIAVWDR
jgi:xanthine dehydrogenase small subunit